MSKNVLLILYVSSNFMNKTNQTNKKYFSYQFFLYKSITAIKKCILIFLNFKTLKAIYFLKIVYNILKKKS